MLIAKIRRPTGNPAAGNLSGNSFMNINYTLKRSRKRRKTISLQISNSSESYYLRALLYTRR